VFTGERLFGSTLVYACVHVDGIDRACCEFTVGAWAAKPPGMNRLGGKVSILSLKWETTTLVQIPPRAVEQYQPQTHAATRSKLLTIFDIHPII